MNAPPDDRIDALIAELSLDEQVALLTGDGTWWTVAVPRLGIGRLKMIDGPTGARGDGVSGTTSTCFPVGICLGATWDRPLLEAIGAALAAEARAKGAGLLLGPTVNLQRHPITGRVFECYSEDPCLSAGLATAWVRGLQSGGVGACIKHFVANDQEFERHTIDAVVSDRALRELYLRPFAEVVAEAGPWSVMGAYNRVNGTYACSNAALLEDVLRGEWGWDGCVVSDWGAALETVANANGGLDLEMPGPTLSRGTALLNAVHAGHVEAATVAGHARRVLQLVGRAGRLDATEEAPEGSLDRPEHRRLAHDAAVSGMVLLTNDGTLPLGEVRRLAVIGPNAAGDRIQGGGSSVVRPHRRVRLLQALAEAQPDVELIHRVGAPNDRYVPLPDPAWLTTPSGEPGVVGEWIDGPDPAGEVVARTHADRPGIVFTDAPPEGVAPTGHVVRFRGLLAAPAGRYRVGLTATGPARVALDGRPVLDIWDEREPGQAFFSQGSAEQTVTVELDGGAHELTAEYHRPPRSLVGGLRVGVASVLDADALLAEAVEAAAAADAAVVVVGLTSDWEAEGFDRDDLDLPGRQDELVRRVAAANPRTIVVVNAGSPVAMPWLEEVAAVLQAWYAGQEQGPAIAEVLFGRAEPGGRLPLTYPRRIDDSPAFAHYPGDGGRAVYGEDLLVGYRGYQRNGAEPLFPFGHGCGYTTWRWGAVSVAGHGTDVSVVVELTNTGPSAGSDVVQVYRRWVDEPDPTRPVRELVGFTRVRADASGSVRAQVELDERAFRRWEDGGWQIPAGDVVIEVGASAGDIRGEVELRI